MGGGISGRKHSEAYSKCTGLNLKNPITKLR